MHSHTLENWRHSHRFHNENRSAERNTLRVVWLTLVMMVVEIVAGWRYGSMALLADGWHMGTHFFALGITAFAYYYARRNADNPDYSFGTGKVAVLGGFTSAIVLALVALLMAVEALQRLLVPETIHFDEALLVAAIGLIVNVASALLLNGTAHSHAGDEDDHQHQHDHNLKAAYLHVLADALTSVLAIVALLAGRQMGWVWLDPAMGVVGALVITRWAYGLLQETSRILLDRDGCRETTARIRQLIETDGDNRIVDLHVWKLSSNQMAAILAVVSHFPQPPGHYKALLKELNQLAHITVEVHTGEGAPCLERTV